MNQPETACLFHRLFEDQATRTPDTVALIDDNGPATFAELNAASDRLAATIRTNGIQNGSFVGIYMERSRQYVTSVLGVLKANSAAVPLPPSYPIKRLREILSAATLEAVIDDHATPLASSLHDRILHVSDAIVTPATESVAPACNPDQPAFVLCSSGSTGMPKMIARSHRSFFHRLQWTWRTHPYESGEVCCQKSHMTTTHAVYELFEPLLRGVPVYIVSDQEARALESFWETIKRRDISRLLIVPSVLQASMDMPNFAPPSLKVLVLMGEYVHATLAARTVAAFSEAAGIYSIYGSTEASSTLVCNLKESVCPGGELPLGNVISPEVRAYVLDDDLEPVVEGSPGMLYIAGPALFSEYFRNPALTDAAFITLDGERAYRTNDQVRRTTDGVLQFLGRTDHIVKVRGFRVDPQEVEKTITEHAGVNQCAVIAKNNSDGSTMLVAFVVPVTARAANVYRALREHLPDYMLPSRVIELTAIPLTARGKIDRHKLLEEYEMRIAAPSSGRARSETERRVMVVWKDVLGHNAFEVDSNFFEAGGTSLKTASVVARLRDAFGLDRHQLPGNSVYQFPTVEALASCIDSACACQTRVVSGSSALVTLKTGQDAGDSPLFVISSAGGTLGAYEKLVRTLKTTREVIGVRDPYLWGERDPTLGFQSWIEMYLDAIRRRQPEGPYYLVAYSSAGVFGYEIARHLRHAGEEVGLLALIDPLAMDRASKWRFGYWALKSRFMRRPFARLGLLGGELYGILPRLRRKSGLPAFANDFAFRREQFVELETQVRSSQQHILELSALLELNTGLPFALTLKELTHLAPERYLDALLAKVNSVAPDLETKTIERLVVQYQLQVRSQHQYRLQQFDGTLVLFDPQGSHYGLLASQFRPYVNRLFVHRLVADPPVGRTRELAEYFPKPLRSHYLSMRDDAFVRALARELEKLL